MLCAEIEWTQASQFFEDHRIARKRRGGGEGGIRTLGTRKGTTVFETAPFDHSGTSPHENALWRQGLRPRRERAG